MNKEYISNVPLRAPFPYFGGKYTVAEIVWNALDNPAHYIEPFFGSGAVLLSRPNYSQNMCETVNDKDGFVCNVWRSIKYKPDEVSEYCDYPVNHIDLQARRKQLIKKEETLIDNLVNDPEWCCPKLAGYWIWAASCWIGSGLTKESKNEGCVIPATSKYGEGVHGQIPSIISYGKGVHRKRPAISRYGAGVHGQRPHIGDKGQGIHSFGSVAHIYEHMKQLAHRLRRVRVVCGDWNRVCGGNWQDGIGVCGMFFDPPYADKDRDSIYHKEDFNVAKDVEDWCLQRGDKKSYRIVVAGYDSEYSKLVAAGWIVINWSAQGGYSNMGKSESRGKANRHREVLLFSPHCIFKKKRSLF